MDTLLLVEDDKLLRLTLKENLDRENFIVFEASVGRRALEIIAHHHVDLILLDINLPDGNGLDFIEDIRKKTDVPLIIVSGSGGKESRLSGLELGADDYVSKPVDIDELVARIKANLRRYKGSYANQNIQVNGTSATQNKDIRFGCWTIDYDQFQIFDEEHNSANLTIQEFKLLEFLIDHAGVAQRREDMCEAIREENYVPTPRAIDVKITRIRKKIDDEATAAQIIKTVRGVGYMFNRRNDAHESM